MSKFNNKAPPPKPHKKWLSLAMIATALLLLPRRSSRQDDRDNDRNKESGHKNLDGKNDNQ